MTRRKKGLMMIKLFKRKCLMLLVGNLTKSQYSGYDCQKRRIQDWIFGRRSHLQSWPTLRIDRVTSQNGDRVLFERLETPRPTPKVTLKQNWQSQRAAAAAFLFWHRRTKLLETGLKKGRPGWSTRRHGPLHRSRPSPQETGAYNFEQRCGYSCRWQGSQHTCTLEERSCDWRRNTWCLAKNRAKLSSRWVMWSKIQGPSCLLCGFKEQSSACGKHIRPDQEMIRRMKTAIENFKAPFFRTSFLTWRGHKTWTQLVVGTSPQGKRRTTRCENEQQNLYVDLG